MKVPGLENQVFIDFVNGKELWQLLTFLGGTL